MSGEAAAESNLYSEVGELAAEFGDRYIIGTVRSRDGVSLAAVKRDRADEEPGVYAVITPDAGEMRDALLEDEEDDPPGPSEPDSG